MNPPPRQHLEGEISFLLNYFRCFNLFSAAEIYDHPGIGVGIEKYRLLPLDALHQLVKVVAQMR